MSAPADFQSIKECRLFQLMPSCPQMLLQSLEQGEQPALPRLGHQSSNNAPMSAGSSHKQLHSPLSFYYYQQKAVVLNFKPRTRCLLSISNKTWPPGLPASLSPCLLQGMTHIPNPDPHQLQHSEEWSCASLQDRTAKLL